MNKERRKAIEAVKTRLENLKAELESIHDEIDTLAGEESDYFDNMPESFQEGDKGQAAEAARDALYEARDAIDNFDLDEITGYLDTAAE